MTEQAAAGDDGDPRVYRRIETLVRERISDGTLKAGAPVPPIDAFRREFGCARETAGKAMRSLVGEGLLVRYPGLATTSPGGSRPCAGGAKSCKRGRVGYAQARSVITITDGGT